jgi:Putative Se/S carrier protein-like
MIAGDYGVVLFHAIHLLFTLEKAMKNLGLPCQPIPTPRELSSDCGTALRFKWQDREKIQSLLAELMIENEGLHPLGGE